MTFKEWLTDTSTWSSKLLIGVVAVCAAFACPFGVALLALSWFLFYRGNPEKERKLKNVVVAGCKLIAMLILLLALLQAILPSLIVHLV